jgi:hypothetical protein
MTKETLDHIPLTLDLQEILAKLGMKRDEDQEQVKRLMDLAQPLLSARAAYRVCYIDERLDDGVRVSGTLFRSKVLRKHLDGVERVFAYVVTIGESLEQRANTCDDFLERYILDVIGNTAVSKARAHLKKYLKKTYGLDGLSTMSPGQIKDWPIEAQKPLFQLLGDTESSVGVRLEASLYMTPPKSLSGLYFPTEVPFFACQLCPRERCPSRRSPYDETLRQEYGIDHEK